MDVLARFPRSPHEEIWIVLTARQGHPYLEVRVHHSAPPGEATASPEALGLPVALVDELSRALQVARAQLSQRGLLPAPEARPPESEPRVPPPDAGRRGGLPTLERLTNQHGRVHPRVPLEVPLEYAVRGRSPEATGLPWGQGRTVDINRGGLQVVLPERLSVFTVLAVTLHLPMGALSVVCRVVWAQFTGGIDLAATGCRHGLAFTEVGAEERRRLEGLLEELGG